MNYIKQLPDIDRIDGNLTTLEVTSIPRCTTSTSTDVEQSMNEQDISTDEIINEQINEPKNEKLLMKGVPAKRHNRKNKRRK